MQQQQQLPQKLNSIFSIRSGALELVQDFFYPIFAFLYVEVCIICSYIRLCFSASVEEVPARNTEQVFRIPTYLMAMHKVLPFYCRQATDLHSLRLFISFLTHGCIRRDEEIEHLFAAIGEFQQLASKEKTPTVVKAILIEAIERHYKRVQPRTINYHVQAIADSCVIGHQDKVHLVDMMLRTIGIRVHDSIP
jgi:hypothetical protein